MVRPGEPGYAFAIPLPSTRFAVGVVSHRQPKGGSVVWIAQPVFEATPSSDDVANIRDWRWATMLPVASGVRQKVFVPIGSVDVPAGLQNAPVMRAWALRGSGWNKVRFTDDFRDTRSLGTTEDKSLSIYSFLTSATLAERIDNGWAPQDDW
jgi:hypothetical protein